MEWLVLSYFLIGWAIIELARWTEGREGRDLERGAVWWVIIAWPLVLAACAIAALRRR